MQLRSVMHALALTVVVAPAVAQSINLDLGYPGTAPPSEYRGVGMPGFWNKFELLQGSGTFSLMGLDAQPAGANIYQIGGTETVYSPLDGPGLPTGHHATLLGDALVTHTTVENCLYFTGLDAGIYEVTSYAWMPTAPSTQNSVHIDTNPAIHLVGAPWTGAHAELVTFTRHYVEVTGAGWIRPHSGVPPGGDTGIGAALNAMQIRKLDAKPPLFPTATVLGWLPALNATTYDVLRGDVAALQASDGDFSVATLGCVKNDTPGPTVGYLAEVLLPGEARWYLVRANTAGGPLTYDDWGSSQVGSRDAEIQAAPAHCN